MVPAHTRPEAEDHRRLGVAVRSLRYGDTAIALDDRRLSAGWHAPEADLWRWTDGDAAIALPGGAELRVELAMTGRYWAADPRAITA